MKEFLKDKEMTQGSFAETDVSGILHIWMPCRALTSLTFPVNPVCLLKAHSLTRTLQLLKYKTSSQ